MTLDAARRRTLWQIALLSAGFLVLVAISITSIVLVNKARDDSRWVVHTVEVENQISTVLLDIRRAESAARGYLLTFQPKFLEEHQAAVARIPSGVAKLAIQTNDSAVQIEHTKQLRAAVESRLAEFTKAIDFVKQNDIPGGVAMLRDSSNSAVQRVGEVAAAMRAEEDRLFQARTVAADRSQSLAAFVTTAGSGLVLLLAGTSLFLVRQSTRARDKAEQQLRDNNLNLEAAVETRTADLREANDEIQRFAYIVSHDLRSPLVNIMGFTSELEELRTDIFTRIARYSRAAAEAPSIPVPIGDSDPAEAPELQAEDKQLSQDFSEALGFIKSSIGKMDRLISAILNLTREGRRDFHPVEIDTRELIETIISSVAHQASEANAQIRVEPLPDIVSDRLALEQIFSNLIDNALKYLKPGVPGDILIKGRPKLGFIIFEIIDNGRGIDQKDHTRIFDLFRRAGLQDRQGQGIGLAHVRALVRRMGGTINVSSELHTGSTFTVTLPARWNYGTQGKEV
ncbi:sensor histidine kinase [Afipia birgiae]|uniref:sensor histidine kinase n=1 Tax=Afipia birgiae TaxID=151414 RepID=UPI00037108D4|nr:CHASE3 domain-containing protein [Afipia birgiae]MBX9822464.1 CHASE3 domain-containing protein [Afipia birgiae]